MEGYNVITVWLYIGIPQIRMELSSTRAAVHTTHLDLQYYHLHQRSSLQPRQARSSNEKVASTGGSVIPVTQWDLTLASQAVSSLGTKISIIKVSPIR